MINHTISEEEFDGAPIGQTDPSPDINLGSHLPNPLSASIKTPRFTDKERKGLGGPPQKISGVSGNIILDSTPVVVTPITDKQGTGKVATPDQINNVRQKEDAMSLSGVTRLKTYAVISRLLEARKYAEVTDKQGNVNWELVDDLEKQRQGAEMALRVMGDMIEHKQVEYGIADSTLEKLKSLSVDTLRARAAELLEGKRKAIDITAGGGSGGSRINNIIDADVK